REGRNLLGAPTFELLESGRFKCLETGHEVTPEARASYADSKHCRAGLIDAAIAQRKPPLNMFKRDPASCSKLICRLTGVTINKTEQHIWMHMNGKHFLNALDKKEVEKAVPNGTKIEEKEKKMKKEKKKNKSGEKIIQTKNKSSSLVKNEKSVDEIITELRDSNMKSSDSENEPDFWMPPVGERWDCDNGGDRWGSDSDSVPENDGLEKEDGEEAEVPENEERELSKRTKRMSIEIDPASRKKKRKTN
ncbi:hypothetical protein M569_00168, partial [Genlisea aurea]